MHQGRQLWKVPRHQSLEMGRVILTFRGQSRRGGGYEKEQIQTKDRSATKTSPSPSKISLISPPSHLDHLREISE